MRPLHAFALGYLAALVFVLAWAVGIMSRYIGQDLPKFERFLYGEPH